MADLQLLLQQLMQGQINLQNHIEALANAQAAPVLVAHKKVVTDPGAYDGSPAKFHEWWSKIKIWMQVLNINYCCGLFTDYISARAHYSRLRSTIVPSVACQTTEGEYHSTNPFLLTDTL